MIISNLTMNKHPFDTTKNEDGASILSILVMVGLLSFLVAGFSLTLSRINYASKTVDLKKDILDIKNHILTNIDCINTLKSNLSACSQPSIQLQKKNGFLTDPIVSTGLIAGSGRIREKWYVQTTCASNSLLVKLARISSNGHFTKDPLTGKIYDFNNQVPLFGGANSPKLCSGIFQSANITSCNDGEVRFIDGELKRCNGGVAWAALPSNSGQGRVFQIVGSGNITLLNFNAVFSLEQLGSGDIFLMKEP